MFFTAGRSLQCVKCGQIMESNCRSLASVATTVHCPPETSNYVLSCSYLGHCHCIGVGDHQKVCGVFYIFLFTECAVYY